MTLGPLEHLMREIACAMTKGSPVVVIIFSFNIFSFNSTFFGGGPEFEVDFGSSDVGVLRMRRRQMA